MTGTHKLGWVSHSKRECHHPQKQGLSCDVRLTHSSMERGVIELTGLVSEEGRVQSPDIKPGKPRLGLKMKETTHNQEGETLETERSDINKDGRDQGCSPEDQTQKFEVYDKGKGN